MHRKEITKTLSIVLEKYLNPHKDTRIYMAKEVTFYYGTENTIRVDYMLFKPVNNTISGIEKGDFYCYEIKSSVEDFHTKHGHNFIGDFNYYVMLEEVYDKLKDIIPYKVGVYIINNVCDTDLKLIKKAKRADRERPALEMLLMMFRSANRENIKCSKRSDTKNECTEKATTIGVYATDKKQTIDIQYESGVKDVLYSAIPSCQHEIQTQSSGGIKCINCGGWFCY